MKTKWEENIFIRKHNIKLNLCYVQYLSMCYKKNLKVDNIITGTTLIFACYTLKNEGTPAQKNSLVIIYGWLT